MLVYINPLTPPDPSRHLTASDSHLKNVWHKEAEASKAINSH